MVIEMPLAQETAITADHIHRSSLLSELPGVVHGVTTRVAGAGSADGNIGYTPPRDREDAWAMRRAWLGAAGLDPHKIVVVSQVHGGDVAIVTAAARGPVPMARCRAMFSMTTMASSTTMPVARTMPKSVSVLIE